MVVQVANRAMLSRIDLPASKTKNSLSNIPKFYRHFHKGLRVITLTGQNLQITCGVVGDVAGGVSKEGVEVADERPEMIESLLLPPHVRPEELLVIWVSPPPVGETILCSDEAELVLRRSLMADNEGKLSVLCWFFEECEVE